MQPSCTISMANRLEQKYTCRAKNNCWPLAVFHAYWPTILAPIIMPHYSPERFSDILASLHELCGFPNTAAYLVVSLDGHRHKQFIMATQFNQMANALFLTLFPTFRIRLGGGGGGGGGRQHRCLVNDSINSPVLYRFTPYYYNND